MGRRFYVVAACAGYGFANLFVSVPLRVVATNGTAAEAGTILAGATVAIAAGALAAGSVGTRLRGGPRTLVAALVVVACGSGLLAAASGVALVAAGAVVVGAGIGMFWVGSQFILSRRAGDADSAHGFLWHYAAYTSGTVAGSAATGAFASAAAHIGLGAITGIRAASILAGAVAVGAIAVWRRLAVTVELPATDPSAERPRTLAMQLPDLLLVTALALLLPLAPIVLDHEFALSPFAIGIVMGGVALAKLSGTVAGRLIAHGSGPGRTILILLASAASFCFLLATAFTLSLFVTALFATALAATGAWPLVVDAAQSRVPPAERRTLTVVWNAREYALVAVGTGLSGWLLGAFGSAGPVFAIAALLIGGAAAAAAVQLRRPVWRASAPA
jgi:MFS family permease